jgi:outer membrane protein assembly factor BamB
VDDQSRVHALAKDSGASVWNQDKLKFRKLTAPLVFDRLVWVGDYEGYLHILAPETGDIIGRIRVDSSAINAMVPANGGVIVQTANGTVALVASKDKAQHREHKGNGEHREYMHVIRDTGSMVTKSTRMIFLCSLCFPLCPLC